ncbi:MAG: 2-succinyl-5-enolpyruvyl-6-hydroxy-3-cyclohexene-1-carboxylic-acid synthase [Flavobacteriaceae bacterium]|nr:2-succinyl-5-enolpyruvyl-6-hydroxy-3-cyclohexene-1-carboxylic-acid synthase [Flavobacteriaceae bacterium]
MNYPKNQLAQTIIQLFELKGIKHIVISPGSRNAPLTIGFTNQKVFTCYSIVDERCAAFFALGIAQQTQEPVAVVCTSGSALLNYYPAVAEAFYSDIPLVVLSADRPQHLIGIGDGQTINQKNVFANHVLYEANLSESHLEQSAIEINKALNTSKTQCGPVHINVPFSEPLYDMVDALTVTSDVLSEEINNREIKDVSVYRDQWKAAKRKIVLVGANLPNAVEQKYLDCLATDNSVIVFTETTSNLHHESFFPSIDKIIAPLETDEFEALQPDILLTFGGLIVSKKIKAFLRNYQPKAHWHVDAKKANDTFFCLTQHFKHDVNVFFNSFFKKALTTESHYKSSLLKLKSRRGERHQQYLKEIDYSDFTVFDEILKSIPENTMLQLGNSSTIRYTQLFDLNPSLKVFCNRGTSGIDGSTSTAIGAASVHANQTVLITGDLSFFYDSNALWNNYIPKNLRIILINNGGGGIFRILPGHKNTENFDEYFETVHDLNAKSLCEMYKIDYVSTSTQDSLLETLDGFYQGNHPKLLEIFTPRKRNDEMLLNYFKFIK